MTDKSILRNLKILSIANDIVRSKNKPYDLEEVLAKVDEVNKAIDPKPEPVLFVDAETGDEITESDIKRMKQEFREQSL